MQVDEPAADQHPDRRGGECEPCYFFQRGLALILASQLDHPSVVDAIIKAGANVNHIKPDGGTALIMASQNGGGYL